MADRDELPTDHAGTARRTVLVRPPGRTPPGGWPLVLFLHGTGGTADWADADTGWGEAAERDGFLLALPEGLPPDPAKPPKFLTNPPRWNDGATRPGDRLHTDADDVGYLAAAVGELVGRGEADPGRVFVCGFSNGAGMAFRLAAERAELVAAVAPVAGYCWTDAKPVRPVPTLYVVGDADPLIPLAGGPVRLPWGGPPVTRPAVADTLARWERLNGQPPRTLIVPGLGHHWPGGKGLLGAKLGGPIGGPVDGTAAVWEFFREVAERTGG
jgi:polyhydroxybutyrate depolymerase